MFSFQQPLRRLSHLYRPGHAQLKVDPDLVIPNKKLSILEGAITASGWNNIKGTPSPGCTSTPWPKVRIQAGHPGAGPAGGGLDVILYGTKGEKSSPTTGSGEGTPPVPGL